MSFRLPKKITTFVNALLKGERNIRSYEEMIKEEDKKESGLELFVMKNSLLTAPALDGFTHTSILVTYVLDRIQRLLR